MKVLINALSARRGGIVTYTRNLMRSFQTKGVDAVFALPRGSPLLDEDVETVSYPVASMSPLSRVLWEQVVWRREVRRIKPDVLYSSANFGLILCPVPQVLLVREGGLFDPIYLANIAPMLGAKKIFERILRRKLIVASAKSSDLVLTPTNATGDLLRRWSGDLSKRIRTNLYGTRLEKFQPALPRREWRQDGSLRILMVTAYYAHKQPGIISEAVRRLNEDGITAHLTLTTDIEQIEYAPGGSKDAFLLRQGLDRGEVTLLGHVDYANLPALYAKNDLFVTPSMSETFGHPLIEAMATATPVIASDISVHREVCGRSAVFFPGLSVDALVDAVKMLDRDPQCRRRMLDEASTLIKQDYSWDGHVDRLLENLETVAQANIR